MKLKNKKEGTVLAHAVDKLLLFAKPDYMNIVDPDSGFKEAIEALGKSVPLLMYATFMYL